MPHWESHLLLASATFCVICDITPHQRPHNRDPTAEATPKSMGCGKPFQFPPAGADHGFCHPATDFVAPMQATPIDGLTNVTGDDLYNVDMLGARTSSYAEANVGSTLKVDSYAAANVRCCCQCGAQCAEPDDPTSDLHNDPTDGNLYCTMMLFCCCWVGIIRLRMVLDRSPNALWALEPLYTLYTTPGQISHHCFVFVPSRR
jgi:hypothetical protein